MIGTHLLRTWWNTNELSLLIDRCITVVSEPVCMIEDHDLRQWGRASQKIAHPGIGRCLRNAKMFSEISLARKQKPKPLISLSWFVFHDLVFISDRPLHYCCVWLVLLWSVDLDRRFWYVDCCPTKLFSRYSTLANKWNSIFVFSASILSQISICSRTSCNKITKNSLIW